ncbi:SgcJ/EcaC family oxidoreductase [Calothrix sp. PCC 6303]|uniref:SgcJ/EcaC family oxidoreductase n=1 Tax=Calothrix sp. PCC 6303 TaxID=1170562 RepID=UPI0002A05454|nr:SgcJ/EcaC family oxidoreductase [Calothrix sp. PCC 6303]AFZ03592.1 Calcium/calmodulin dependent protein kinase II association-domain protein [Calothrix sp. PCC 6303]
MNLRLLTEYMLNKTLISLTITALTSFSISLPSQAEETQCANTNSTEIASLFDKWNSSLQTGNPEQVTANYAANGVLLPTVSNKVRHNKAEIKEYFQKFLLLKPAGKIDEQNIRIYCNLAINSGVYTFNLTQNGKVNQVQARYTFVYQKADGDNKWLIVEHHSSAMPEKLSGSQTKKRN